MKNFVKFLTLAAVFSAAANSYSATDWIFDYDQLASKSLTSIKWSETVGSADVANSGYWYYLNGENKVYMQGSAISAADNFTIGNNAMTSALTLNVDTSLSIASLNVVSTSILNRTIVNATSDSINLNISGALNLVGVKDGETTVSRFGTIEVGSVTSSGQYGGITAKNRLIINGDADGLKTDTVMVMQNLGASTGTGSGSFETPDVLIKGVVSNWARVVMTHSSATSDLYYKIGGFNSSSGFRFGTPSKENLRYNLVLTNAAGTKYTASTGLGECYDGNDKSVSVDPQKRSRLTLYVRMADDALQYFGDNTWSNGRDMLMSGGIVMDSGKLSLRFNQNAADYTFTAKYKKATDTAIKTYTVTYWTGTGADAERTTSSHGDLVINGGTIGCYLTNWGHPSEVTTYGTFRFSNIIYKGGLLKLRLKNETSSDVLDLTSYYQKEVAATEEAIWLKEGGGTVKLADDAAAGTKVTFDFGTKADVLWLKDSLLNDGKGMKVIAWDEENKTALGASDFYANGFTDGEIDYSAIFSIAADGLYVKYGQVVPEPATLALIFGALTLGLAVYRKRK